jgi:hypothetical protein
MTIPGFCTVEKKSITAKLKRQEEEIVKLSQSFILALTWGN